MHVPISVCLSIRFFENKRWRKVTVRQEVSVPVSVSLALCVYVCVCVVVVYGGTFTVGFDSSADKSCAMTAAMLLQSGLVHPREITRQHHERF